MRHEKVQIRIRKLFGFPDDASVADVVSQLVGQKEYVYATEMLFGCTRDDDPFAGDDLHFAFYMACCIGRYPELLKELARQHRWQDQRARRGGYSMQIFPGEWFIVLEPFATRMLRTLFGR